MNNYPIIPGRGLVTKEATEMRLQYLKNEGIYVDALSKTNLQPDLIRNNIESFIGSVEIPVGIVGPLLFNYNGASEMVYAAAGTLEGALIASMNRGAKVISKSGGFMAVVVHQKMIRSPLFIFNDLNESIIFKNWMDKQFDKIKSIVEQYSNHAKLQTIEPFVTGKGVHLKFVYTTGDASGQNMTTTCTWHGVLWINQHFIAETSIKPIHFVIEGNGASDKKVSHFSMQHGRGMHVIADCELEESVIEKVLRTNSTDFLRCISQSRVLSQLDGMVGYNINVANAIAALFVATGQDLGSVHESSTGILNIEKTEKGLYFSLILPSLVIGTLGGGTHLPKQQEALKIMGCAGSGKIERFAQLIAGFALSLEISTFAAIVGGQFAKAHEKLGRNKPVNWLTRSEINKDFLSLNLNEYFDNQEELVSITCSEKRLIENGIIINLTSKVNQKIMGFMSIELSLINKQAGTGIQKKTILIKSKPLDKEVIKGLHLMAASIDPHLADLISQYQETLEYSNCHKKEIYMYEWLHKNAQKCTPQYFGMKMDEAREIFLLFLEHLDYTKLILINSENNPERWTLGFTKAAIKTINDVHTLFSNPTGLLLSKEIKPFEPWHATPLYEKLAHIIIKEYDKYAWHALTARLLGFVFELETEHRTINVGKTVIHNDFNPRNICIRQDESVCIYDWELAVIHFPHRDIVELLSFTLPEYFDEQVFTDCIRYHFALQTTKTTWQEWKKAYIYALKEYLVTRVSFYMTGRILMDYEFAIRLFLNSFRMLDILETL